MSRNGGWGPMVPCFDQSFTVLTPNKNERKIMDTTLDFRGGDSRNSDSSHATTAVTTPKKRKNGVKSGKLKAKEEVFLAPLPHEDGVVRYTEHGVITNIKPGTVPLPTIVSQVVELWRN